MLILIAQEFLSPNKSIEDLCKYKHYVENSFYFNQWPNNPQILSWHKPNT